MPINSEDTFTFQLLNPIPSDFNEFVRVVTGTEAKTYTTPTDSERYCPDKILRSGNRTIVFWNDGTKTIVKRSKDEPDNTYAAFTAALAIKIFGSNSWLQRMIKRKTEQQESKKKPKEPMNTDIFYDTLMRFAEAITPKESSVPKADEESSVPKADDLMQMTMEDI